MTTKRAQRALPAEHSRASQCPIDGHTLDDRGFCWKAGGYPIVRWSWYPEENRGKGAWGTYHTPCPFVCPTCQSVLHWDGACMACFGSRTPKDRDTWRFPGDSYTVQRGHWMFEHGPMTACTFAEVKAGMAILKQVLGQEITANEAREQFLAQGLVRSEYWPISRP